MLEVRNVSKSYGSKKALNDVSFRVEKGEICGFIGHNGAGKTTMLHIISGILPLETGEVWIDDFSINTHPIDCKRKIAFLPDTPTLYEFLTGLQFLEFIADVYEVSEADRKARIALYSDMLDMTENLNLTIQSYSHGMKQKIAILAALIHDPEVMILDEPFVGLDPKAINALKNILRERCERGGSVLFSTHILDVAEKICDTIAVIRYGKLVAFGATESLKGSESLETYFLEIGGGRNV